jgi:protein MpaA
VRAPCRGWPLGDYSELERRWKQLRNTHAVSVREVACVGSARTMLVAELGDVALPCVTIAAGIHGNEPAAPWALLNIVESELLDPSFSYRMWPCINPTGYARRTRSNVEGADINRSFTGAGGTPEAKAIVTANRDRRFAASLDLHEDPEANGFYCFEPARAERTISPSILVALGDAGLPLQELIPQFDLGYEAGTAAHAQLERGRVIVDFAAELAHFKGVLPFTLYMAKRAARVLTLESAGMRPWGDRLSMHRVAVRAALDALSKVSFEEAPN